MWYLVRGHWTVTVCTANIIIKRCPFLSGPISPIRGLYDSQCRPSFDPLSFSRLRLPMPYILSTITLWYSRYHCPPHVDFPRLAFPSARFTMIGWPHILLQLQCLSVHSSRSFEFREARTSQPRASLMNRDSKHRPGILGLDVLHTVYTSESLFSTTIV